MRGLPRSLEVKSPPASAESDGFNPWSQEAMEKEMATYYSIPACEISIEQKA